MGAVENDRKHNDLSMWDPWIHTHESTKKLANQWKHGCMHGMYAWNDLGTLTYWLHGDTRIVSALESASYCYFNNLRMLSVRSADGSEKVRLN